MKHPLSRLASLVLATSLWLLPSCTTPSIPIPPPKPDQMRFALDLDTGTAQFEYRAPTGDYAGAVVYVFNRDVGIGVITTAEADGTVEPTEPFPATAGDEVVITFETDSQLASTCVSIQDGQSSSALECDL